MLHLLIGAAIALQAMAVLIMAAHHMRAQNHKTAAALAFAAIVFLLPASAMALYSAEDEAINTLQEPMVR
jgi:threonine/homoserine efflux transporter RhtA